MTTLITDLLVSALAVLLATVALGLAAALLGLAGRRDRWARLAPWLIVLGFAGVLFTYIGAGLFIVGEHSYGTP